jgi:nucleoside-diphosphate kinase
MEKERTFAMLKPGVLQRRLLGEIISRLEKSGFNIVGLKMLKISRELAETHYGEHKGKAFYDSLVDYITSDVAVAMVLERVNAIATLRKLAGATNPEQAAPGTLRADYAVETTKNIIHASDAPETAKREISLFFDEKELFPFQDGNAAWF